MRWTIIVLSCSAYVIYSRISCLRSLTSRHSLWILHTLDRCNFSASTTKPLLVILRLYTCGAWFCPAGFLISVEWSEWWRLAEERIHDVILPRRNAPRTECRPSQIMQDIIHVLPDKILPTIGNPFLLVIQMTARHMPYAQYTSHRGLYK